MNNEVFIKDVLSKLAINDAIEAAVARIEAGTPRRSVRTKQLKRLPRGYKPCRIVLHNDAWAACHYPKWTENEIKRLLGLV